MDGLARFGLGLTIGCVAIGWSSGVGDGVGRRGYVDSAHFLLSAARDLLRDQSARPMDGTGEIDLDRATTSEPSSGSGERICGREETCRR